MSGPLCSSRRYCSYPAGWRNNGLCATVVHGSEVMDAAEETLLVSISGLMEGRRHKHLLRSYCFLAKAEVFHSCLLVMIVIVIVTNAVMGLGCCGPCDWTKVDNGDSTVERWTTELLASIDR